MGFMHDCVCMHACVKMCVLLCECKDTYLSTHTVYQYEIYKKSHYFGGYGHIEKWIQGNIIFMRFCCCFKLSKNIEKLLNEQPTHTIAKWTLTGLVQ